VPAARLLLLKTALLINIIIIIIIIILALSKSGYNDDHLRNGKNVKLYL